MIQFTPQDEIRKQRDQLLAQSDWTQLPDSAVVGAKKSAWAVYRQALRDLPNAQNISAMKGIDDAKWPAKPA